MQSDPLVSREKKLRKIEEKCILDESGRINSSAFEKGQSSLLGTFLSNLESPKPAGIRVTSEWDAARTTGWRREDEATRRSTSCAHSRGAVGGPLPEQAEVGIAARIGRSWTLTCVAWECRRLAALAAARTRRTKGFRGSACLPRRRRRGFKALASNVNVEKN